LVVGISTFVVGDTLTDKWEFAGGAEVRVAVVVCETHRTGTTSLVVWVGGKRVVVSDGIRVGGERDIVVVIVVVVRVGGERVIVVVVVIGVGRGVVTNARSSIGYTWVTGVGGEGVRCIGSRESWVRIGVGSSTIGITVRDIVIIGVAIRGKVVIVVGIVSSGVWAEEHV